MHLSIVLIPVLLLILTIWMKRLPRSECLFTDLSVNHPLIRIAGTVRRTAPFYTLFAWSKSAYSSSTASQWRNLWQISNGKIGSGIFFKNSTGSSFTTKVIDFPQICGSCRREWDFFYCKHIQYRQWISAPVLHLNIIPSILCDPRNVKGYWINPFMAREHDDYLFNPQPTKNISKVTLPLSHMIEYDFKVV